MGWFTRWSCIGVILCSIMVSFIEAQQDDRHLSETVKVRCYNDSNCKTSPSYCDPKTNGCRCVVDGHGWMTLKDTKCGELLPASIKCNYKGDCLNYDVNSECSPISSESPQKFCKCVDGYVSSENGSICMQVGSGCRDDQDCKVLENTECRNKQCKCRNVSIGLGRYRPVNNNTRCELQFLQTGSCTDDQECSNTVANSVCYNPNAPASSDNLGNLSTDSNQTDPGSDNLCMCQKGYRADLERDLCVAITIGDPCVTDQDCSSSINDTVCRPIIEGFGKVCQCALGYEYSKKTGNRTGDDKFTRVTSAGFSCSKRKLGSPCHVDSDCNKAIDSSMCEEGSNSTKRCVCVDGHRGAGGNLSCRKLQLEELCETTSQCSAIVGGALCTSAKCQCQDGFKADDKICVKRKIDDRCNSSKDCSFIENSRCYKRVCKCKEGFVQDDQDDGICRRRQIGEACTRKEDCSPHTPCVLGVCRCQQGWVANADRYSCRKLELDSHCDNSPDCDAAVKNSECQTESRQCKCLPGYFYKYTLLECQKLKIGSYCSPYNTASTCSHAVTNSRCIRSNRICACVPGYYASQDMDKCIRRQLRDACDTNTDCDAVMPNSRCVTNDTTLGSRECQCILGYMDSGNRQHCRKRQLNDACSKPGDCSMSIWDSVCQDQVCQCRRLYEPFNSTCVSTPKRLHDQCTFNDQCRRLDTNSSCSGSLCICSNVTFANRNKTTCLPLPSKIGSACGALWHCQREINDSFCDDGLCQCERDHFASEDRLSCPKNPQQLGDYCDSGIQCKDHISYTVCNASSCVCRYGYLNASDNRGCIEREHLGPYRLIVQPEEPISCQDGVCQDWTNSTCTGPDGNKMCTCKGRTARQIRTSECDAAQTYQVQLEIYYEADVYDYKPLALNLSEESKRDFSDRLLLSGIKTLFENSVLKDRYLSSEILNISCARWRDQRSTETACYSGVRVLLLVHITADYLNAEKTDTIFKAMQQQLRLSYGTIADSMLRIRRPFKNYIIVSDFNECLEDSKNDCAAEANCINTLGSYMCVCRPSFVDVEDSLDYAVRGKACTAPEIVEDPCLNGCDTNIEIVVIVLVLFILTIMVFIVYEIIKRKKSFNARALYAKFGTTKIRKLQKASMRRLKERKKRMKEESKKRREEHRTKKEKMKKEGATQKTVKNEEKKKKAEKKKEKNQMAADTKKAKKAKSKDKQPHQSRNPSLPTIELPPVRSTTSIDMLDPEASTPTPLSPYDNLYTSTPTPTTPYDNLFTYYPVASPDPGVVQDWNLHESQESPV